jgi:hypothetical protein
MSIPVRLSEDLVQRGKLEAEDSDRSLTGQIEHWAKLGMALEYVLGHAYVVELKRRGAAVSVDDALSHAQTESGREEIAAQLRLSGQVRYGVDPSRKGGVVRINPDGTRTAGRFVNRTFVADSNEDG